jgi:multimeric flavodoxin WrbA
MKIMAIVGSPRKGSNVDILIDRVIEGVKSKTEVEVEKVYIYESDIKYCTGCGAHSILQGSKDCPLGDDMDGILKRMQEVDAFIFGSPNHGRTISAGLTNFFARMMPLLKMQIERDENGEIIHAETKPLIRGKKAVTVISQGDFAVSSSALLLMVLDANLRDFHLRKVGEVFSTGNLKRAQVKEKKVDLDLAFETGARMAIIK